MVLSVEIPKITYNGNDSTTEWPLTFTAASAGEVKVYLTDAADVETLLEANYEVDIAGAKVTYPTVVSGLDPIATGTKITLKRVTAQDQQLNLTGQGAFSSLNVMKTFDKIVRMIQEMKETLGRSLQYPVSTDPSDLDPEAALTAATEAAASAASALASKLLAEAAALSAAASAAAYVLASQAEAEAGVENTKYTSSLRVKQAIDKQRPQAVTALTPGATVATDASLGSTFTLAAGQDFTLSNPTNAVSGQRLIWKITQDGTGSRIITLGNAFLVCSEIGSVVLSTAANAVDYIGAIYDGTNFNVIAFASDID